MFRNKQLDRIEKKLDIIIERNYKVDNHKALSELKQPVSPAKASKKRGRPAKKQSKNNVKPWPVIFTEELQKITKEEKQKAKKAAYNKAYYQKNKGKVTTKKK